MNENRKAKREKRRQLRWLQAASIRRPSLGAVKPTRYGGEQHDRAEHIHQEHKGEQNTHIRLEF